MKRMRQRFICLDGTICSKSHLPPFVDTCLCNIEFTVVSTKFPHPISQLIQRVKSGAISTYSEMMEDFLLQISHRWSLYRGVVTRLEGDPDILHALNAITMDVGQNQYPVPAPFPGTLPTSTNFVLNSCILAPYQEWDMRYFHAYFKVSHNFQWYIDHIWKGFSEGGTMYPGTPWKDQPYMTLEMRCLRMASSYNMAFTGVSLFHEGKDTLFPFSCYSQQALYPSKIVKLMAKYNKPTHLMPPLMLSNKQLIPLAISSMVKSQGWDQMFGTVEWTYQKAVAQCLTISLTASAGGRPGPPPEKIYLKNGVTKIVGVHGKKLEQVLYASKVLDQAASDCLNKGIFVLPPPSCKIVLKSEINWAYTMNIEELIKIQLKAREYFIPDLITILNAQMVHGYRQKIERGKMIQIGRDWNRGGMEDFAQYFRYLDPDMRYITFDISAYDTSVVKTLLVVYARWSKVYLKFPTPDDKLLYDKMLDIATERLTTKVTQMIGNVWRVIDGVMPSGAFETSHGDSWITAIVFHAMFNYFLTTSTTFKRLYTKYVKEGRFMLSVYGDDNVLGFPKDMLPWFTQDNVSDFFLTFGNFVLRDFTVHDQFLSVPDGYGGLKYKGVVFLQKYAVLLPPKWRGIPNMPKVVHYRPFAVNMRKFSKGCGDYRTKFDYFLSAIAGVYDNPFNQVWYDACNFLCAKFFQPNGWQEDFKSDFNKHSGYVTKTMRKCNISVDVISRGFPTMKDIVKMNLIVPDKHSNKFKDMWTQGLDELCGLDY